MSRQRFGIIRIPNEGERSVIFHSTSRSLMETVFRLYESKAPAGVTYEVQPIEEPAWFVRK